MVGTPKKSADTSEAYLVEVAPNFFLSNTFLELWPVRQSFGLDRWGTSIVFFMVTAGTFEKMSGRVGCCECAKLPSTYDASLHMP